MPQFAISRWFPVNHTKKQVLWITYPRKSDCAQHSGCVGMSGYELNSRWKELEADGFLIKEVRDKDPRGGAGRGQGRPARNIETHSIKINKKVHERIAAYVAELPRINDRTVSIQDFLSDAIRQTKDWQALAPEIKTWGEPWKHVTVEQNAYQALDQIIKNLKVVRQDIYVNRSNVLCAIALAAIENRRRR